jgi:hypothetical protein
MVDGARAGHAENRENENREEMNGAATPANARSSHEEKL